MKIIGFTALGALMLLGACASTPSPQYFNGGYFMTGGADCERFRANGPYEILCADKKGNITGRRPIMTAQDMQMYAIRRQQQSQEIEALGRQMVEAGESFNRSAQAYGQQASSWTPPAITPIGSGNTKTSCITAGNYTSCNTRQSPW